MGADVGDLVGDLVGATDTKSKLEVMTSIKCNERSKKRCRCSRIHKTRNNINNISDIP